MNVQTALDGVAAFQQRVVDLVGAGQQSNSKVRWKIIENDLEVFITKAFTPGTPDYDKIYDRLHPSYAIGGGDPWIGLKIDAQYLHEALQLVEHRLREGQSVLKDQEPEILIEAGTPHSAYVVLRDMVSGAKTDILMVDPYVGADLFPLLTNTPSGVKLRILTWKSRTPSDFVAEALKFAAQHGTPIEIRWGSEDFHDRFLMVDDRLYMSGGSFKDLGKNLSYVTEVQSAKDLLTAELEKRWKSATKA